MDPNSHQEMFSNKAIVQIVVLQNNFFAHFEKIKNKKLCTRETNFGQNPIHSFVTKKSRKHPNSSSPVQLLKVILLQFIQCSRFIAVPV